ncbi:hypothetical protein MC885_004523 [Smutsia gigantea]|nr:hypothetical protein MC885_004523 [Smutsia gigantea]
MARAGTPGGKNRWAAEPERLLRSPAGRGTSGAPVRAQGPHLDGRSALRPQSVVASGDAYAGLR